MLIDFETLQDLSDGADEVDSICPLCSASRKLHNRNKKVLRIWNKEPGFATYNCTHCGASGSARDDVNNGYTPPESEDRIAKALMAAISRTAAPQVLDKTYDYADVDGTLLCQKLRFIPKFFTWRRPDGKDGWIAERGDRVVPYRLPDLLQYPDGTIFLCEGEKDADRVASLGYCATNVAQGDLDKEKCAAYFAGRDVIIIMDNDNAGAERASKSARSLHGTAKTIRIVGMPDGAKDVSEWLDLDTDNAGRLERLCFDAPPLWEPSSEPATPQSDAKVGKAIADALRLQAAPAAVQVPGGTTVTVDDFYAYMEMHNYIFAPTRATWPGTSVNSRLPPMPLLDGEGKPILDAKGNWRFIPANQWLDQNRPVEQMTWVPGQPMLIRGRFLADGGFIERAGITAFNLYREPTLQHGDANLAGTCLDHVKRVYPDDADHIIKWLAHRVQRPHEKINHAIVLGGAQGIGKDTLLELAKRAIGPWNFSEVSPTNVLGRFNGFLKSVILRISEARDCGEFDRYKFYDHTKSLIAAPPDVLRVDEKNLREYSVPNVCGVVITTNHKTTGIYLPADDRRHYVAWSDLTRDDFDNEYWEKLWRWYDASGDGHVAAYLTELDLRAFNPKAPPLKTQAFWEIVGSSRAPGDDEMQDAIVALGCPDALTLAQIIFHSEGAQPEFALFLRDRKNSRLIPHRLEACGYVSVRCDTTTDGRWKVGGRNVMVYSKTTLSIRERIAAARALAERERQG
jgi:hypothetical protein